MSDSGQPVVLSTQLSTATELDASTAGAACSVGDEPELHNSEGNGEAGSENRKRAISPIQWATTSKESKEERKSEQRKSRSRSPQQPPAQTPSGSPPPEQPSKLRHLFRDARYFMIKSSNYENVSLAKAKGVWATPPPNENRLNTAYNESRSVFLIFSVKESGRFQGFARLAGPSEKSSSRVNWVLPPGLSHRALSGTFRIDWISRQEVQFNKTSHLLNAWNEFKPVKIGRDGQEIEPKTGETLCRLFNVDPDCDLDRLIDRSRSRRRTVVPPTAPTVAHHHYHHQQQHQNPYQQHQNPHQQHLHQHQQPHQHLPHTVPSAVSVPTPASVPVVPSSASSHHATAPNPSSSSSRRHRRSSGGGGGGRSTSSRRSRSPQGSMTAASVGTGTVGSFQGVGKETFINGSYQDYLRQFGSTSIQPDQQQQQQLQLQNQQQLQTQQYQQYAGYGYPYAPPVADPYATAMMYSQQYMMPGQHQMYDYQQYQMQQQQQQQQYQQQVMAAPMSAKEYEQRVNEFIQRTTNAGPSTVAVAGAVGGGGAVVAGGSVSASSDSSSDNDGGGGSSRRRRRSSSRR